MSYIYISHNADSRLKVWIASQGHQILEIKDQPSVYPAISSHADIFICRLGYSSSAPLFAKTPLGKEYPLCAALCAAANDKYFIHNLKIADPDLLAAASDAGLKSIHTNQGFTRCNLLPVGDGFITSDMGIYKVLKQNGIDSLLIEEGHITLHGHQFGFIGGCAGVIGNTAVFNGDLSSHPNYAEITRYIAAKGLNIHFFPQYPLEDIGSIIESESFLESISF